MNPGPPSNPGHPAETSTASPRFDAWLLPTAACFLLAAVFGARRLLYPDLGFHLRGGEWILQNLAFPSVDTYTYTVSGHPYLDIHWLYQVLLYGLFRLGGYAALSLFNAGLILLLLYLTHQRLKLTHVPAWISVLMLTSVLVTTENRFQARPEILSLILMSLTLWVLELRARRKKDLLFLLPLISMVWANVEGLFAIGWFLTGLYWFSDFVHNRRSDNKLLAYSLAAVAACFLNPYFYQGWSYPFSHLMMLGTLNVFKLTISELKPTLAFLPTWTFLLSVYLAFAAFHFFLALATFKRSKIHEFLLPSAFFFISLVSFRNVPLFMISCVSLAASAFKDLNWAWLAKVQKGLLTRPAAAWIFSLILLGLCLRVMTGAYYIQNHRPERFGLGLDKENQPVQACRFLAQNRLDGRILNPMDLGGWLDWQGPRGKTFIDGRLEVMGGEFYSEYMDSFSPGNLKPLVEKYRPDIIVMGLLSPFPWARQLQNMEDWRLVYVDEVAAIYLRKGFGDTVPDLDYGRLLSEHGVSKDLASQATALLQSPPPSAQACFWMDFVKPAVYPYGLFNLGLFADAAGHPEAAEPFLLESIRRTSGRYCEFYYFLGNFYDSTKQFDKAVLCGNQVMKADPSMMR
jgi:hypothetical protein